MNFLRTIIPILLFISTTTSVFVDDQVAQVNLEEANAGDTFAFQQAFLNEFRNIAKISAAATKSLANLPAIEQQMIKDEIKLASDASLDEIETSSKIAVHGIQGVSNILNSLANGDMQGLVGSVQTMAKTLNSDATNGGLKATTNALNNLSNMMSNIYPSFS